MIVTIEDGAEVAVHNAHVRVDMSDERQSAVVHDERYAVVKPDEFTPFDLQAKINYLESRIAQLNDLYSGLSLSLTDSNTSHTTAINMINSAIAGMGGEIDTIQADTTIADALAALDGYVREELLTQTGIIDYRTSQESLNAAFTYMMEAAVAEVEGNVAASYSTKTAVATVENGVANLRAEASTFSYVETVDGKKAISGWKSVADTGEPSAFYVYADTFYIMSPVNGEIQTLHPIQFVGEYASHPLIAAFPENSVYRNIVNGDSYIKHGVSWDLFLAHGEDGAASYVSHVFARSATQPATPSGGSYAIPVPDGWSDGIPAGTDPVWMSSAMFAPDTTAPAWSAPARISGEDGVVGQGTKVQFSIDGSSAWHDTPATGDQYMRSATSTDGGATWTYAGAVKIKGETGADGAQGIQGIPGTNGTNGVTYYTWVKYADTPTTGMSDYPSGKKYLGIAYNKTTATESTAYGDYSWSLIQGDQGIPGTNGTNGVTYYTWIKYADTSAGAGMSDSPSGKLYIGIAVNKTTAAESTNAADYTWALIKGADGATGSTGATGARGASSFSRQIAGSVWSNSEAATAVTSLGAPYTSVVLGDRVTLYNNTTKYSETRVCSNVATPTWDIINTVLDGNMLVTGSIVANRIAANSISVTNTFNDVGGVITATATFGSSLTLSQSSRIGSSFNISNNSDVQQKLLLNMSGRSGYSGTGNTLNWGVFIGASDTPVYEFGWTHASQDMKAGAFTMTIPANTTYSFSLRACCELDEGENMPSMWLDFNTLGVNN